MSIQFLTDYLERAASLYGDKPAIDSDKQSVTFANLLQQSKEIATLLCHSGIGIGVPIAIYLPKSITCMIGMMGTLFSGNIYAPMDVRAPLLYVEKVLGVLACKWILTDRAGEDKLRKAGITANIVLIDSAPLPVDEDGIQHALSRRLDIEPAFILFTSGSTGTPKGVVISHRRVVDYITWAQECFHANQETIIGNQAPFLFTVSVMDLFLCLSSGAHLYLIPEHVLATPHKLVDFIIKRDINFIFWVPSAYMNIEREDIFSLQKPETLKHCLYVGEPMPPHTLQYWMEHQPQAQFFNLYGSTETDMTIFHKSSASDWEDRPPILGKPRYNVQAFILDENGNQVPEGQVGEIYISGSALANGYWNDIERTRESFIQNPLNVHYQETVYRTGDLGEMDSQGNILFHGRRDHQFKHLGYRVEAYGIEQIAQEKSGVQSACVAYDYPKKQIVLFYTAQDATFSESELRAYLLKNLPAYMLPTRFIPLSAMPLTSSGKKDRILLQNSYLL